MDYPIPLVIKKVLKQTNQLQVFNEKYTKLKNKDTNMKSNDVPIFEQSSIVFLLVTLKMYLTKWWTGQIL